MREHLDFRDFLRKTFDSNLGVKMFKSEFHGEAC
jgi:hypothetical protein